ncbi:MAG: ABC transporter permease, partial [Dehalococcoidia bacterium]
MVVTMLVFGLSRISGDPRSLLISEDATIDVWDELGREMGLDQPVYRQYLIYVGNLFRGDLGNSTLQRKPVTEILWSRIPNTVRLAFASFLFALLLGIPLGVLSA